eukprot:4236306-Pyramimonas_sp.AAC.1
MTLLSITLNDYFLGWFPCMIAIYPALAGGWSVILLMLSGWGPAATSCMYEVIFEHRQSADVARAGVRAQDFTVVWHR